MGLPDRLIAGGVPVKIATRERLFLIHRWWRHPASGVRYQNRVVSFSKRWGLRRRNEGEWRNDGTGTRRVREGRRYGRQRKKTPAKACQESNKAQAARPGHQERSR